MTCTLIRLDTGLAFVTEATLENNADGSVSFKLADGGYAGQEPRQYGVRHDGPHTQQYQRATVSGATVVFKTRPEDPPYAYLLAQGQVFPS